MDNYTQIFLILSVNVASIYFLHHIFKRGIKSVSDDNYTPLFKLHQIVDNLTAKESTVIGQGWLVSYADVALNGAKHTLHDYSPEIDKNLIIHCYQPEPGYCACVLQVTDQ